MKTYLSPILNKFCSSIHYSNYVKFKLSYNGIFLFKKSESLSTANTYFGEISVMKLFCWNFYRQYHHKVSFFYGEIPLRNCVRPNLLSPARTRPKRAFWFQYDYNMIEAVRSKQAHIISGTYFNLQLEKLEIIIFLRLRATYKILEISIIIAMDLAIIPTFKEFFRYFPWDFEKKKQKIKL